jgi:four helix bundle protein
MDRGKNLKSDVVAMSFDFAIRIVELYKLLSSERREFVLSKQLLRSGTSVGAMVRESQNAESKPDFIHKLAVAQKECDESLYWLELLNVSKYITEDEFVSYSEPALSLLKLIKRIIVTTKQNMIKSTNN